MKVSYGTTSYTTVSPFTEAARLPSALSATNMNTLPGYTTVPLYTGFAAGETTLRTTALLNWTQHATSAGCALDTEPTQPSQGTVPSEKTSKY